MLPGQTEELRVGCGGMGGWVGCGGMGGWVGCGGMGGFVEWVVCKS